MADQTLASLTAATPATGGLIYGTQGGADRKFTLTAVGAALVEATTAEDRRAALELGELATIAPGSGVSTSIANNINSSGGLLTYSIIGTSGSMVPMLNAAATWSAAQTHDLGALGTTPTAALTLANSTSAANGVQQLSPSLTLAGQGWGAGASASQEVRWSQYVLPVQGSTNPAGTWVLQASIDGTDVSAPALQAQSDGPLIVTLPHNTTTNKVMVFRAVDVTMGNDACVTISGEGSINLSDSFTASPWYGSSTTAHGNSDYYINHFVNTTWCTLKTWNNEMWMVNGMNPQRFRFANTYTDNTHFESAVIDWQTTANTLRMGSDVGSGGGTARDVQFIRGGTPKITVGENTTDHAQPVKLPSFSVSGLPDAATCGLGAMAMVSDATSTTAYSTVSGGGSSKVLVVSDGTNWIIH